MPDGTGISLARATPLIGGQRLPTSFDSTTTTAEERTYGLSQRRLPILIFIGQDAMNYCLFAIIVISMVALLAPVNAYITEKETHNALHYE